MSIPLPEPAHADWARLPRSVGDPLYGDFGLGEFVQTAAIADLRLDLTTHPAGSEVGEHAHASPLLLLVLDGEIEECSGGRTTVGRPGSLLVRPEGAVHTVRSLRPSRVFSIEPGPRWLERMGADALISSLPAGAWTEGASGLALRVYGAFARFDTGPAAALALQGYLQALLAELIQPAEQRGVPLWLREIRHYLDSHLAERCPPEVLAARAGVHPVHLSRAFRKHFGVTMTEYVRRGRLASATIRLSTTDDPLSRIARDAGFADQSHFTREFRRGMGDSPSGYRARLRGRPKSQSAVG